MKALEVTRERILFDEFVFINTNKKLSGTHLLVDDIDMAAVTRSKEPSSKMKRSNPFG